MKPPCSAAADGNFRFTYRRSTFLRAFVLLALLLSPPVRAQSPPEYTLEINSTGLKVSEETLGHAFMIVKVRTRQSMKEEAFGFYSEKEASGVRDLPRLIIGTPGALRSEFDRRPNRFAKVEEALEIPITFEQRRNIYQVVNEWNSHHYELLNENCITFVDKVAARIGLPVPARASYATADQYVVALRTNYQQEQARLEREARERAEQARLEKEARDRAERARLEKEARERAEALRIPAGWVPCSCPRIHDPYGKLVNGVLYHPDTLRCPR